MILNVYSIYDTVAQVFNKPFTEVNNETAIRAFRNSADQQPHINDYVLYHLGSMTDHDGVIKPNPTPFKIFSGFDLNQTTETPELLKEQA